VLRSSARFGLTEAGEYVSARRTHPIHVLVVAEKRGLEHIEDVDPPRSLTTRYSICPALLRRRIASERSGSFPKQGCGHRRPRAIRRSRTTNRHGVESCRKISPRPIWRYDTICPRESGCDRFRAPAERRGSICEAVSVPRKQAIPELPIANIEGVGSSDPRRSLLPEHGRESKRLSFYLFSFMRSSETWSKRRRRRCGPS
jgi:hypothetical protein